MSAGTIYFIENDTTGVYPNAHIVKRDENGTETKIHGFLSAFVEAVATDTDGNIVVYWQSLDPVNSDKFITKLTPDGKSLSSENVNLDYNLYSFEFDDSGRLFAGIRSEEDVSWINRNKIVELDPDTFEVLNVLETGIKTIPDITVREDEIWFVDQAIDRSQETFLRSISTDPSIEGGEKVETFSFVEKVYTGQDGKIYLETKSTDGNGAGMIFDPETGSKKTIDVFESINERDATSAFKSEPTENPIVFGTDSDDVLVGDDNEDIIIGLGGNDKISGLGGDDVLIGSEGDDEIRGGLGNDQIFGETGNNKLYGGDGDDVIFGNPVDLTVTNSNLVGSDYIEGGNGNDGIFTGVGGADIFGGDGNDYIESYAGDNSIHGDAGDDHILGGIEQDTISGGTGDDDIFGRGGKDHLNGDEGDDLIIGGADFDFIVGGTGDDVLLGEGSTDQIIAGDGNDFVSGGDGDDSILGGKGNDVISGGSGVDLILAEEGNDVVFADQGDDFISLGSGIDVLFGGAGSDQLFITKNDGQNFWNDFEDGADKIGFMTAVSQSDFANDVVITSTLDGLSTYIGYGETALILEGVMADQIDESDFILAETLV